VVLFAVWALPGIILGRYALAPGGHDPRGFAFAGASIMVAISWLIVFLLFVIPAVNSYTVVRRLTEDTGPFSILPLFDEGFTIKMRNINTWLMFTTPTITGSIAGFPVTIYYTTSSRSSWSKVDFKFSPLSKEGSRRIYGAGVSFTLYFKKRLKKDVKPEVLQCIDDAKKNGLVSGAGRALSTKHYESYAD